MTDAERQALIDALERLGWIALRDRSAPPMDCGQSIIDGRRVVDLPSL